MASLDGGLLMGIRAKDRLILALDVSSPEEAHHLLSRVGDSVGVVKVGLELFCAAGPRILEEIRRLGRQVFLDLKFLDIDETVRRATSLVAGMGVQFLTVHAERKALEAAVKAREEAGSGLKILAVTVLTNLGTQDLREGGVTMTAADLVIRRAEVAAAVGCDGVVASGEEARRIRERTGARLTIVTPGIRPASGGRDEHARASTPGDAIAAGADFLVVGRPIRDAVDPRAAADRIVAEMQQAFDARKS